MPPAPSVDEVMRDVDRIPDSPQSRCFGIMTGMEVDELIARHPRVFHTMSATAWPSVQRHGLLSTQQLVDLFGLDGTERDRLLAAPREESAVLCAPGMLPAVIRDQKPMKFVAEKIEPHSSLTEYLAAINSRVFFWASLERLDRLRQAKEYRAEDQAVLHVDTRALVERHGPRIELCRFNSGAVTQKNHPMRGHRSWLPIVDYPYDEYRRRYGRDGALVEVTVLDAVPDILDLTDKIEVAINWARRRPGSGDSFPLDGAISGSCWCRGATVE